MSRNPEYMSSIIEQMGGAQQLRHPDLDPPPPFNQSVDACYSSYLNFLITNYQKSTTYKVREDWIEYMTSEVVWETIQQFGPNSTYTQCDGITRLKFLGKPTRTVKSEITVTMTERVSLAWMTWFPDAPHCYDSDPYHCRRLQGLFEVGGAMLDNTHKPQFVDWIFSAMCPIRFTCTPVVDEVVLLYWPEDVATRDICGSDGRGASVTRPHVRVDDTPVTAVIDAITFRGQDMYLRRLDGKPFEAYNMNKLGNRFAREQMFPGQTYLESSVMTGRWTFTSPSVYLAHRPIGRNLEVSPSWAEWPQTKLTVYQSFMPAGVLTLDPSDVSTVRAYHLKGMGGVEHAQLIANGSFEPHYDNWTYIEPILQLHPMTYGDLLDPVPASAYFNVRTADCWGNQTHCSTITDDSFRPKLMINPKIWSSVFNGFLCSDPLLADPPIALVPLSKSQLDDLPMPLPKGTKARIDNPSITAAAEADSEFIFNSNAKPGQRVDPDVPMATPTALTRPRPALINNMLGYRPDSIQQPTHDGTRGTDNKRPLSNQTLGHQPGQHQQASEASGTQPTVSGKGIRPAVSGKAAIFRGSGHSFTASKSISQYLCTLLLCLLVF
jgi:hypothetical protein